MSNFSTWAPLTQGIPGSGVIVFSAVTPDSLATITAAGYLNDLGKKTKLNDVWYINYSDTSTQPLGEASTLGIFQVTVSGGNTSLTLLSASSKITLPFVVGDFLSASSTTGGIKDSGIAPTAPAQPFVASISGAAVVGDLPSFNDVSGTLIDSGIAANKVLQAAFSSPDVNANTVFIQGNNLTNANLIAGTTLFTPTGSKSYLLMQAVLDVSQAFAGGSNNLNMIFDIGSTDVVEATAAIIKAAANTYSLGQTGFTFISNSLPITNAAPLKLKAQATSDYTSGIATAYFILVRVA